MRDIAESHAELLLHLSVICIGKRIKLGRNDRNWHQHQIDLLLLHVFVATPLGPQVLFHFVESLGVRLLQVLQRNLRLFPNRVKPKQYAFNRVSWLGQVDAYADCSLCNVPTDEGGFEKIGEIASASELVDVRFYSFFVSVPLHPRFKLKCGRLGHVFLDLLVEEFRDQR